MSSSLRLRLTLWYTGAFSLVLVAFSAGVYFIVERILREHLDGNLRLTLQMTTAALARYSAGSPSLVGLGAKERGAGPSLAEVLEEPHFRNQIVAVVDASGLALARRPANSASALRLPATQLRASPSPQFYELPESSSEADDSCRGIYQLVSSGSGIPLTVVITDSMEQLSDQLDTLQNALMIAVVLALLVVSGGGWWLARESLVPLTAMAAAAERITASNLDKRLPVASSDELGRLASRFNELLSRLSTSFSQQRQFMADASHELRSPLSVVRTAAQVALLKPERPEPEYRETLTLIEQQAGRLNRIVEDLFTLARSDMNQLTLDLEALYLDELIADTIQGLNVLAENKGVHLQSQEMPEARYRGDDRLLRQMISNLLDNAIQFTPYGGRVDVKLSQDRSCYVIAVTDTGNGIPVELQPRVFERFFQVDKADAGKNGAGGAGLGLAIARSIAELHGGWLVLQHSGPKGSTFCISLPFTEPM